MRISPGKIQQRNLMMHYEQLLIPPSKSSTIMAYVFATWA